jgi:hypothetical protein
VRPPIGSSTYYKSGLAPDSASYQSATTSRRDLQAAHDELPELLGPSGQGQERLLASKSNCTRGLISVKKKKQKSARELAELVAERIGIPGVQVAVHSDPVYGWHPTVFTIPAQAVNAQNAAERAAQELRALYELCDERAENDRRPLTRPLAVLIDGKEESLRTLGHAAKLLTEKLGHRASSSEWQHANQAIMVAQDDYTDAHRDLATNLVEHVCRAEGLLARP